MATEQPTRPEFVRPANPDGTAGGWVELRNGETILVDELIKHERYVTYIVGPIARSKPWDLIEHADTFLDPSRIDLEDLDPDRRHCDV